MIDGKSSDGTFANFAPDADWENQLDPKINWRHIGAKSNKTCTGTSNCKLVAHWYRNFTTTQTEEDVQLTADEAGAAKKYHVKGWAFATDD